MARRMSPRGGAGSEDGPMGVPEAWDVRVWDLGFGGSGDGGLALRVDLLQAAMVVVAVPRVRPVRRMKWRRLSDMELVMVVWTQDAVVGRVLCAEIQRWVNR